MSKESKDGASQPGDPTDDENLGSDATLAAPVTGDDATLAAPDTGSGERTRRGHRRARTGQLTLDSVELTHYETGREVARGGMGRILTATDNRLHRPVAIKQLLSVDDYYVARFEREALITARLQHPAIVPVYDAGRLPSGEPFYCMKMVDGRPLDKVIRSKLQLVDRMALLSNVLTVAEAMAYAHSERVIHRDLKPANVLVGSFGETVVIDWGLAKDLLDDTEDESVPDEAPKIESGAITMAGAVIGTPAYMPPEQATGAAVDERADVFALGAILYHVLAGKIPYEASSAEEMLAHVVARKFVPLEERVPEVPRELRAIVDRAMADDPDDRYPSARELADELKRYRDGQLVGAHSYSTVELLTRWIRRHRAAVSVAAVMLVLLAVVSVIGIYRIVAARNEAENQRTLAEQRKAAAEGLVDYMVENLRNELEPIGRLDLLSGVGDQVQAYYRELEDSPDGMGDADLDRWSGALDILGEVDMHKGDLQGALESFRRTRQIAEHVLEGDPHNREWLRKLAQARLSIGLALKREGKRDEAVAEVSAALEIHNRLTRAQPDDLQAGLDLADSHDSLGDLLRAQGELDSALAEYNQSLDTREHWSVRSPDNSRVRFGLSISHDKVGSVLEAKGDSDSALGQYRQALDIRTALVDSDPQNTRWQASAAKSRGLIGDVLRQTGQLDEALVEYRAALPVYARLSRQDSGNATWQRALIDTNNQLGVALVARGEHEKALVYYREGLAIAQKLTALDPYNATWQLDLSRAHNRVGDALRQKNDLSGALASYQAALEIRAALSERDPNNRMWRRLVAWSHHKLGRALYDREEYDKSLVVMTKARDLRSELSAGAPGHLPLRYELATSNIGIGRIKRKQGDKTAASDLEGGVEILEALVDRTPDNTLWQSDLARAYMNLGELGHADEDYERASTLFARALVIGEGLVEKSKDSISGQSLIADACFGLGRVVTKSVDERRALLERSKKVLKKLQVSGRMAAENNKTLKKVERELRRLGR